MMMVRESLIPIVIDREGYFALATGDPMPTGTQLTGPLGTRFMVVIIPPITGPEGYDGRYLISLSTGDIDGMGSVMAVSDVDAGRWFAHRCWLCGDLLRGAGVGTHTECSDRELADIHDRPF